MNIIGKQGGNRFAGAFFIQRHWQLVPGHQSSRRTFGRKGSPPRVTSEALGGQSLIRRPDRQGQLWFFGTFRYLLSRQGVPSMYVNKNAGNPNA